MVSPLTKVKVAQHGLAKKLSLVRDLQGENHDRKDSKSPQDAKLNPENQQMDCDFLEPVQSNHFS